MTDTSKYTGSHKERFDQSGKGKGIQGRQDKAANDGYVGNYKGAGTYDAKHLSQKKNNWVIPVLTICLLVVQKYPV